MASHSGCCASDNEHDEHNHGHNGGFSLKRESIPVAVSMTLFVLGLIFYEPLHNTAFSIGEYLVFIPAYLVSGWSVLKSLIDGQL